MFRKRITTNKTKKEKPMWLRVQESEFEQAQDNAATTKTVTKTVKKTVATSELDERVKNVSQTRRALVQAQIELKSERINSMKNKDAVFSGYVR